MKRIFQILIALLAITIIIISFTTSQSEKFYYAFDKKTELNPSSNKIIVRFSKDKNLSELKSLVATVAKDIKQDWTDNRTVIITTSGTTQKSNLISQFESNADVVTANPVYTTVEGEEMGVTDEFMVDFLPGVSTNSIDSLNKKYHVNILKKSFYYLLQAPPKTDVIEIANQYYETGLTKFSHPNFIAKIVFHQQHIPNDTYFNYQWNFRNTGQTINDGHTGTSGADIKATQAWYYTKGASSIVVAVIDEGVSSDHPDLPNTRQIRLPGSNFADGNSNDPSPTGTVDTHGNACAGLIAATQDNGQGVAGICPDCKIMPIKIANADESFVSSSDIADAITFAYSHGADVISNSWGYSSNNPNLVPAIVTAIQNATTNGRNGLGCVVAFSAGNFLTQPGFISFPACVNVAGVLTVGASDRYDKQAAYSPTANPSSPNNQLLDVVAPSHRAYPEQISTETFEVWSIDMPGTTHGYNKYQGTEHPPVANEQLPNSGTNYDAYTGRFGGTSAACPQVAGVAALVLSLNPNLTQQQVYNVITSTADKVGGYTYTNGRSNQLGFGRINAYDAVLQELPCSTIVNYTNHTVSTNTNVSGCFVNSSAVTVTAGKLTITSTVATTITPAFTINAGAQLQLGN